MVVPVGEDLLTLIVLFSELAHHAWLGVIRALLVKE